MQKAWIVAVGSELMLGQVLDTNSAWLAGRLAALGFRAERHITVGDAVEPLAEVLEQAADRCDVILVTGGLGPTDDDLTRLALAAVAGVPLELDPASVEQMRCYFAARQRPMPENNLVQARLPRWSAALLNTCGTAPGILVKLGQTPCYALPGVPHEMRSMFEREVVPRLKRQAGDAVLLSRRLHVFGLPEAVVGERLADLMRRGRNPEVGTTAVAGIITIRINAWGATPPAAEQLLNETESDVRARLGTAVFGTEEQTLASVVGELLIGAGCTLSTAESCTGGLIGKLITDVAGSSQYYLGGVIAYANRLKTDVVGVDRQMLAADGAVSPMVARQLAEGAAQRFGSDYAIGVTGVAGPGGGTAEKPVGLVFIGLRFPGGASVEECRFGADNPRELIRQRAAYTALNLLRLKLLEQKAGAEGGLSS